MADRTRHIAISYWWTPPTSPMSIKPNEPDLARNMEHLRLPRIGQVITWILPRPQTAGQETPFVIATGRVTRIEPSPDLSRQYIAFLERCRGGLPYRELCACIHAQVVGFHPELGCVEGKLVGLFPACELAGIEDPLMSRWVEVEDDDEDDPTIWVDWSTVWTVQGLEMARGEGMAAVANPGISDGPITSGTPLSEEASDILRNQQGYLSHRPHLDAIATPFLIESRVVLLVTVRVREVIEGVVQFFGTAGREPTLIFDYHINYSQSHARDKIHAKLVLPSTQADFLGNYVLDLPFNFQVQPVADAYFCENSDIELLRTLLAQLSIEVIFYLSAPTLARVHFLEVQLDDIGRERGQKMMESAVSYARDRRHTEEQWLQTEAHKLLAPERDWARGGLHIYKAIYKAYLYGILEFGSIEELTAVATGQLSKDSLKPEVERIGEKRKEALRAILDRYNLAVSAIDESPAGGLFSHTVMEWEQTEAHTLLAEPAQRSGGVLIRVYEAIQAAYRQGEIDGSRDRLEDAAVWRIAIYDLGPVGRRELRKLLGLPLDKEEDRSPTPFHVYPRWVGCDHHGWFASTPPPWDWPGREGMPGEDLPFATIMCLAERARLVFCCAECYGQRQQHGWPNGGMLEEIVTRSERGFVEGLHPYSHVYVPLAGEAKGKCFSVDRRFWHSDPPTLIKVRGTGGLPLRNPKVIDRQKRVKLWVKGMQQGDK